jgi:cytoskeletal protein CcmA (bactofilin family)
MENIKDNLLIGEGVNITGNISVQGAIHVYGNLSGEIVAQEIFIGATGKVNGEIKVSFADVRGEITNSIHVKETLIVRSTGKISGTITYQSLEIEHGGIIDGKIEKNSHVKVVALPQVDDSKSA